MERKYNRKVMIAKKPIHSHNRGTNHFREVRNLLMNTLRIIKLEGWNDYPIIFDKVAKLLPKIYAEAIFAFCQEL